MPLSAKAGCRVRACSSLSAGGGLGGEPSPETIFQLPTEEEFLCACRRFRPAGEWTTFSIGVNNGSAQTDGSHGPRWRSYSPGYCAPGRHPHAHRRPMLPICHGPRACAGDQTTARRQPCILGLQAQRLAKIGAGGGDRTHEQRLVDVCAVHYDLWPACGDQPEALASALPTELHRRFGCGGRTRTCDLLVMSQASCLCYHPAKLNFVCCRGLAPRLPPCFPALMRHSGTRGRCASYTPQL